MSGILWSETQIGALWKRKVLGEAPTPAEGRSLRGGRGPKVPKTEKELKESFGLLWKHLVLLDRETRRPLLEAMVRVCVGQMGPYRWRRLQPALQLVLSDASRMRLAAEPGSRGRTWRAHQILATHRALQEEFRQEGVARTALLDRLEGEPMRIPRNVAGREIGRLIRNDDLVLDEARDVLRRVPGPEGKEFLPLEVTEITWVSEAK